MNTKLGVEINKDSPSAEAQQSAVSKFENGRAMLICGNTADMLSGSRYAAHFRIDGDKHRHFGLFDCASVSMVGSGAPAAAERADVQLG